MEILSRTISMIRSLYPGRSLRFQCCGTEQERFAVLLWAILAVLPNSNSGSSVPDARTNLRSRPFCRVLYPPSGLPYHPSSWLNDLQTPAVPHARLAVVRNHGAGDDTSATQLVPGKAPAIAIANASCGCGAQAPAREKT